MKSLAIKLTILLTALIFTACSNMQIGFEEDSMFYQGPSVEVELSTNDAHTYKLSIDEKYDYITLAHKKSIKFNLETGSNVVSIRRDDKQVKHITIDAQGKEKYYIEVVADASDAFEIKRVEKKEEPKEEPKVKEAVVAQEVVQEKPAVQQETQQAKEVSVKTEVKEEAVVVKSAPKEQTQVTKSVKKEVAPVVEKKAEDETTFSYSREDGE